MSVVQQTKINGVDLVRLRGLVDGVASDPANAVARFSVTTGWTGGTRSETRVEGWSLGGRQMPKDQTIRIDEPLELCGTNTQPNPQEYLMAAFNACMMVGYVAGASIRGIELEHIEIETSGELDLRGFLGLDASVKPGYERIHYAVRIRGNGTADQFSEIHDVVMKTSPNRWNISNPIELTSDLIVQ
jgi:uncharacterized OsmC-like protein